MAIHPYAAVARGELSAPGRRRRIVFTAGTVAVLEFASVRRLDQSEGKFRLGGDYFLSLCRHWRNSAIGRIDNHRGAHAGVLAGHEQLIVGAVNVEFGPALRTLVFAGERRAHLIQFGPLLGGKIFLVRKSGRALQRRISFLRPKALQIGVAPGRFQRRARRRSRRLLSLRPRDRRRYDNADSSRDCDDRHHRGPEAVLHARLLFLTFHGSVPWLRTSRRQLILERYTNRPRFRKRARVPWSTRCKLTVDDDALRWRRHRPHRHAPAPRDELRRFIRSPRRRVPESKLALRRLTLSPQSRFRRSSLVLQRAVTARSAAPVP